jgi:hypothetical protein
LPETSRSASRCRLLRSLAPVPLRSSHCHNISEISKRTTLLSLHYLLADLQDAIGCRSAYSLWPSYTKDEEVPSRISDPVEFLHGNQHIDSRIGVCRPGQHWAYECTMSHRGYRIDPTTRFQLLGDQIHSGVKIALSRDDLIGGRSSIKRSCCRAWPRCSWKLEPRLHGVDTLFHYRVPELLWLSIQVVGS